jgi:Arc/MetJ-type ribon-helix-helix transcriptional regulator
MQKKKITITVSPKTIDQIDKLIEKGKYRSRSHFFEYAALKLIEKERKTETP